jgi:hypothetical protein
MRRACYDPRHRDYRRIGTAGVTVCPEWLDNFTVFYRDMGERPHGHDLALINPGQPFSKQNCHWVPRRVPGPRQQQARGLHVEVAGRMVPLAEAARIHGVNLNTVRNRMRNLGWDARRALTTPVRMRSE